MLQAIFSWINSHHDPKELPVEMVTCSDFETCLVEARGNKRRLIADIRVLRLSPTTDAEALKIVLSKLKDLEYFISFLEFCCLQFSESTLELSSFQLAHDYLLSTHQETKAYLLELTHQLQFQDEPAGVSTLFHCFIEDTAKTAASLIWLLQNGVSAGGIIESGILHRFFAFDIPFLETDESQVKQLFLMLSEFPEARTLIESAGKIQSNVRGVEGYSLVGVRSSEPLDIIEVKPQPCVFYKSSENAHALYQLFGKYFLAEAITQCESSLDEVWEKAVKDILNDTASCDELSGIIKCLAESSNSALLLQKVLGLFTDTTLQKLLERPGLRDNEWFLTALQQCPRYINIVVRKIESLEQLFQANVSMQLKKALFTKENYHAIEDAWDSIVSQISALQIISKQATKIPTDKHKLRMLIASQLIVEQGQSFGPKDLADLMSIPAELNPEAISEYERLMLDLLVIIDEPTLREEIADEMLGKYGGIPGWAYKKYNEQTLLELAVKNGNVGMTQWLLVTGEYPLPKEELHAQFELASKLGQWPIVRYFLTEHCSGLDKSTLLKDAALQAAREGELPTLKQIVDSEKFKGIAIPQIVSAAVEASQAEAVAYLLERAIVEEDVRSGALITGMQQAFSGMQGTPSEVQEASSGIQETPSETLEASSGGDFEIVRMFISTMSEHTSSREMRKMQNELKRFLLEAVTKEDILTVKFIAGLEVNRPDQCVMEKALVTAAREGSLQCVKFLCESADAEVLPSELAQRQALITASGKGKIDVINYFCNKGDITLDSQVIDASLQKAAEGGHLCSVQYLCRNEVKPSKNGIKKAKQAAKRKNFDGVVTCLEEQALLSRKSGDSKKDRSASAAALAGQGIFAVSAPPSESGGTRLRVSLG